MGGGGIEVKRTDIMGVVAPLLVASGVGAWILSEDGSLVPMWAWVVWSASGVIGLLALVTASWSFLPGIAPSGAPERYAIGIVCALGALGGYARWMNYLFGFGDGFDPGAKWVLWPLLGSIVALVVVLAFRAGVLPSTQVDNQPQINWILLYAIAALAGLFAPEAISHLARVFEALFPAAAPAAQQGTAADVAQLFLIEVW